MSPRPDPSVYVTTVLDQLGRSAQEQSDLTPVATAIVAALVDRVRSEDRRPVSLEALRALEDTIHEKYREIPAQRMRALLIVSREAIAETECPEMPVIGALIQHRPTPSPLTHHCLSRAALADTIEQSVINWLEGAPTRPATAATLAGVALLLAILRGGITDGRTLQLLVNSPLSVWLSDGLTDDPAATHDAPWLSLPPLARWSMITLAMRYPDVKTLAEAAGLEGLAACLAEAMPEPPDLKHVLEAARARVRRDAPDWLVRLMLEDIADAVVTTATRQRLLLDVSSVYAPPAREMVGERPTAAAPLPSTCSATPQPAASTAFVAGLIGDIKRRKHSRDVVETLTRALPQAPCAIGALLVALALHWMEAKRPPRASSIARYLSALRHVPAASTLLTPFQRAASGDWAADPDVWSQMLTTAASPPLCSDYVTPRELIRLHTFATGLFPELRDADSDLLRHLRDLSGSAQKRTAILTDLDVERACDDLARHAPQARNERLLLELGYATGARRNELAQARLSDLVERADGRFLLLIRSHGAVKLKTKASRRDVPLHLLLTKATRKRLQQHVMALQAFGRPPEQVFLFADVAEPDAPPPSQAFQRIIHAMRRATGDPNLTFHSLRHSAICWLMLLLLGHEIPVLRSPPFPGLQADRWSPAQRKALLEALCPEHHQAPDGFLPRDWLFGLARLVGHSTPRTLLVHYQHLRPWFQWAVMDRYLPTPWPLHLLDRLASITSRTRQRQLSRQRRDGDAVVGTGAVAYTMWLEHRRPILKAMRKAVLSEQGDTAAESPTLALAPLQTVRVPLACRLLAAGHTPAEVAEIMDAELDSIGTIHAALSIKVVQGWYAPPLEAVSFFKRRQERGDFFQLAQRLDALACPQQVLYAWRKAVHVHGRWAWAGSRCLRDVIHQLFNVLPDDAVLIVECQPQPALPEDTVSNALDAS